MARKRIEYPGLVINNGDAQEHFDFFETVMRQYYAVAIDKVLDTIGPEGKVLDIGCGAGVFGVLLCDKTEYFNVSGLERSSLLVRVGEAISSRVGYGQRISLKTWEEDTLPFNDNEFDAVVSVLSLHRWGNCARVFREIERVRKDKSTVYIADFRREISFPPFSLYVMQKRFSAGKSVLADLQNSFRASYTGDEVKTFIDEAGISGWDIEKRGKLLYVNSTRTIAHPVMA